MQAEVIQGSIDAPLTAADRCDRCGAQAYMRATLIAGGLELLFCNHHAKEHKPKLQGIAYIQDETHKLSS